MRSILQQRTQFQTLLAERDRGRLGLVPKVCPSLQAFVLQAEEGRHITHCSTRQMNEFVSSEAREKKVENDQY